MRRLEPSMNSATPIEMTPSERAARAVWDPLRDPSVDRARRAAAARRRGLLQGAIGFAAAALLAWRFGRVPAAIAAGIATVMGRLALVSPLGGLARVDRGVARFAGWVGTAVSWLLMTPLYYLVLTPLGLALRARRKLRIRRGPDPRATTYWTELPPKPAGTEPYERQF
jgi:hypothetical protein